jgi:hypothetical protein
MSDWGAEEAHRLSNKSTTLLQDHNYHRQVERSIREVKKLFDTVYCSVKVDIMGYETCYAWQLNNLPLCLGSKY